MVWGVRLWWAAMALVAGPVLADGLQGTSPAWRSTASIGLWALWAAVMVGVMVAHPMTLVLVRLAMLSAVVALVWAGAGGADWGEVALVAAITGGAAAVALSAPVGQVFVNGISYGDEVRLLLRPPAVLLAGPLPAAAIVSVGGVVSGPLLLAGERWWLGGAVTVIGGVMAVFGMRSLHSLTRRWLVFVPAGVVLHDHLAVQDPVLLRRRAVSGVEPATHGSGALDLSQGAAGLILEMTMSQPITLTPPKRTKGQSGDVRANAILVAPSRPGLTVTLAHHRRLV